MRSRTLSGFSISNLGKRAFYENSDDRFNWVRFRCDFPSKTLLTTLIIKNKKSTIFIRRLQDNAIIPLNGYQRFDNLVSQCEALFKKEFPCNL
jgi:hypothetical protein